jgi:hypothetical protein
MNWLQASRRSERRTSRSALSVALWGVLPCILTGYTLLAARHGVVRLGGDFHYAFWPAGDRVLHGLSPYVGPGSAAIAHATAFVYPAVAALALAPFAWIPHGVADYLFAVLQIAAALLTLRVLEVRDWRLYGLVLLSPMVFAGWSVANVTLLLGLGVAAAWRWRERAALAGALVALVISFKLFLWPLSLWLLATRRYAALAYMLACGAVLNLIAWTALGWNELDRYGRLLHSLSIVEERRGYSLIALARRVGIDRGTAYALALALAGIVAVACITLGRRRSDIGSLALALAASLLAAPIVQLHYFALLLIPLAVVRPRLSAAWALPLLVWVAATGHPGPWQVGVAIAFAVAMVTVAIRERHRYSELSDPLQPFGPQMPLSLDLGLGTPSGSSVVGGPAGR